MKTLVKCILLAVAMLMYAGCSNHPPSAAQFMNVKENGTGLGLGASIRSGDIYRGEPSYRSDDYDCVEDRANLDLALLFRYGYGVFGLSTEDVTVRMNLGMLSKYIGLQGWGGIAPAMVGSEGNPFFGGMMLIEEYPVTKMFRVGVSEYISRNAYKVDENLGGFGFYSSDFYEEYGGGFYISYDALSFEFRYGREIGEPRNRFYFTINCLYLDKDDKKTSDVNVRK